MKYMWYSNVISRCNALELPETVYVLRVHVTGQ